MQHLVSDYCTTRLNIQVTWSYSERNLLTPRTELVKWYHECKINESDVFMENEEKIRKYSSLKNDGSMS